MRLFVTDTLDDPHAAETQLGSGLKLIAEARRRANEVKAGAKVTVVIGNPPYRERAEGMGGWVENGSPAAGVKPPLDAFRDAENAQHAHNLKNLYVYFWRWATWKVFDANRDAADGDAGVVCFITTAGYLGGPGFAGMREYLRRTCDEGWVIDLSPEGQTPDVATRVFPCVRQPLAIGLFLRRHGKSPDLPADIHYTAVHGRRAAKFATLAKTTLGGPTWRDARADWTASFTPAAAGSWDQWPALDALMPWTSPGCTGNRGWPYAPSPSILAARWHSLRSTMASKNGGTSRCVAADQHPTAQVLGRLGERRVQGGQEVGGLVGVCVARAAARSAPPGAAGAVVEEGRHRVMPERPLVGRAGTFLLRRRDHDRRVDVRRHHTPRSPGLALPLTRKPSGSTAHQHRA
jgi:hypothetical protein